MTWHCSNRATITTVTMLSPALRQKFATPLNPATNGRQPGVAQPEGMSPARGLQRLARERTTEPESRCRLLQASARWSQMKGSDDGAP